MDVCLVYTSFLCFSFSTKTDRLKQLYLHPNGKKSIANSKEWYSKKVLGIHAIEGLLKKMTDNAGFVGNFTCHSLRATLASRMYEQGLDEQLIPEQTGDTSSTVRNYKRTSDTLKRKYQVLFKVMFQKLRMERFQIKVRSQKKRNQN